MKLTRLNNSPKWVIPTVIAAVAIMFLFAIKNVLQKIGLLKDASDRAIDNQYNTSVKNDTGSAVTIINNAKKETVVQYKKQPSTKTDREWKDIADTLHTDLKYSQWDDDYDDAQYQLSRVKNDTDVWKLIDAFGLHREFFFAIPMGWKNLVEFVADNMSEKRILEINDNYRRKGIKYRW